MDLRWMGYTLYRKPIPNSGMNFRFNARVTQVFQPVDPPKGGYIITLKIRPGEHG